ncbi:hypothetical protein [Novosphingobium taihuense]|uniref:Uncharacterized protein n=1 Tax=Novosphingobium taihuense TaxID=260085 RepID=A0A7W7EVR5_9SPHN|nr:hypothetical protein [Novosphingobium taihuense]MBB4615752.1 hypothetical protein [Novosphingobium taihuense]TWH79707.1 hypothetical protein IQ25_03918 [Novosphingobium taihuense]
MGPDEALQLIRYSDVFPHQIPEVVMGEGYCDVLAICGQPLTLIRTLQKLQNKSLGSCDMATLYRYSRVVNQLAKMALAECSAGSIETKTAAQSLVVATDILMAHCEGEEQRIASKDAV